MMQESAPSRSRKPTARRSAESSAQRERTRARFSSPGLIVRTRKIAVRVSGAETGCETAAARADAWVLMGSDAIRIQLAGDGRKSLPKVPLVHGQSAGVTAYQRWSSNNQDSLRQSIKPRRRGSRPEKEVSRSPASNLRQLGTVLQRLTAEAVLWPH